MQQGNRHRGPTKSSTRKRYTGQMHYLLALVGSTAGEMGPMVIDGHQKRVEGCTVPPCDSRPGSGLAASQAADAWASHPYCIIRVHPDEISAFEMNVESHCKGGLKQWKIKMNVTRGLRVSREQLFHWVLLTT
jgi:hypothetical protein